MVSYHFPMQIYERKFGDHFYEVDRVFHFDEPYGKDDKTNISRLAVPGAIYAWHPTLCLRCYNYELKNPDCPRHDLHLNPLLYINDFPPGLVQCAQNHYSFAKKWGCGRWSLYLAYFPIPADIQKRILAILRYLMFFHPDLKLGVRSWSTFMEQLKPMYKLAADIRDEEKK